MAIDYGTDVGRLRVVINDVDEGGFVFTDDELGVFLDLEAGSVKRAAASAIDSQATNEALAAKVLRTQDLSTDGPKLADALRKHAAGLRASADADDARAETADEGFFDIIAGPGATPAGPEHTHHTSWGW